MNLPESTAGVLRVTLQIKGRLVPLRGMECRGTAFGDCTTLVTGCVGARLKARKGGVVKLRKQQGKMGGKGHRRGWLYIHSTLVWPCLVCHQHSLCCILTKLFSLPCVKGLCSVHVEI